jgi:hypothetical protein
MFTKTKIAMAALLIAAFATPSFARDYQAHVKHGRSYAAPSLSLIEGRNAAVWGSFSGSSTDRESLVQATGN